MALAWYLPVVVGHVISATKTKIIMKKIIVHLQGTMDLIRRNWRTFSSQLNLQGHVGETVEKGSSDTDMASSDIIMEVVEAF